MIKVVNLRKSFNGQEVLRGVNLEIPKGKRTAIIGRSGCGKSVLLKHLVGLIRPDDGEIYVDGVEITKLRKRELNRIRRKFGMVFQGSALFDSMTILENVAFPLRELTDLKEDEIVERVVNMLRQVGLAGMEGKYPEEISGGMKKRVGIARALILKPEFIFFDEPTTGLDPIMERTIHQLIGLKPVMERAVSRLLKKVTDTVPHTDILVSHNIKEVLEVSHTVAMLHDGIIIEHTTPEELMKSSNPVVQQFISGSIEGPIQLY